MDWYLWLKALHVLAVISWMAGLLYLPRLFVYHSEAGLESQAAASFQVMERRLLRAIMNPAMIVAWLTGLYLVWRGGFLMAGWFHGKFVLVLAMSAFHGFLARERRLIVESACIRESRSYRLLNEVPTVLMIGIVCLVIVKPF